MKACIELRKLLRIFWWVRPKYEASKGKEQEKHTREKMRNNALTWMLYVQYVALYDPTYVIVQYS